MPTTYTNGLKLPDLGSIDWFNAYKNNIDILDPIVGTVNGVATTYAPISHNHDASEITSGTIDIARLPPAALERLTTVADQTARYALTTSTVQLGDTVKQLDTGIMYLVVDTTKLNSADGYVEYSAGTASKAIADEDGTSIKTGYVNVAGNQTVTGQKTWSGNQFYTAGAYHRNNSYEIGNTPASNVAIPIYFTDKVNVHTGYVRNVILTTGKTQSELLARNKFTNGALSPTGTEVSSTLQVEVQSNGDKTLYFDGSIRNNVLPYTTNNYSLGTFTNQWSSVYAQSYYYNGTQWGLDKENVWTNANIFSTGDYGQSIWLKNTTLDLSVNGNTGLSSTYQHIVNWVDKNNKAYSIIQSWTNSFENVLVLRSYYRTDANTLKDSSVRNMCSATTKAFYPESAGDIDLGTSTNKWKTLNGVNPGALSLPSTANGVIIDITNWDKRATNNVIGSIAASMDGWINVQIQRDVDFAVWVIGTYRQLFRAGIQSNGKYLVMLMFPVTKNATVILYTLPLDALESDLSFSVYRFYPCLGNV